ncbi:MAG: cation:proton antiporter [Lentisphaerae bacterium]|nr:cation:proton antiporter [Lentisphaerota bacterium]
MLASALLGIIGLAAQAPSSSPGIPDHARLIILTVAGAVAVSLMLGALARRLNVPPLVLFLLGGLLVGPQGLHLFRVDLLGSAWPTLVTLAVELILFTAGLCLPPRGFGQTTWETRGVLTSGVMLTWGLSATLIHLLRPDFPWRFCLMAGSLVIATGPTVIAPLLQRIHVRKPIHRILYWESVLTDPVGALIALFCYELATVSAGAKASAYGPLALMDFTGLLVGGAAAGLLAALLRRRWLSEASAPIALVAGAIVIPAAGDLLVPGSGLLSAIVAGLTLGRQDLPAVRVLRRNRGLLMELLAGPLLVLLATHLGGDHLRALGLRGTLAVLGLVLLVRPLNIFLATAGGNLTLREKLFLSWLAPRGVLCLALAALFALHLPVLRPELADAARFLEAFAFAVIIGTVLVQGFSAGRVGRMLDVLDPQPAGWLIVGAHALAREVAMFVRDRGAHVVLIDSDAHRLIAARREHLPALHESALAIELEAHPELYGIGNILVVTDSPDLNRRICRHFASAYPDIRLYGWDDKPVAGDGNQPRYDAAKPVWSILRPANFEQVGGGAGGPVLERVAAPVRDFRHPERILLCDQDGKLSPALPADRDARVTALVYQPVAVGLDLNVRPEWLLYSHATTMPDVLGELLQCLRITYPALDVEDVRRNLIRQESEYSSLVGYDVALPHFHLEQLEVSVVLAAKVHRPITDAHSGAPIRLVFLVLSPSNQPRTHLQALAEISKFIMDEDNRTRLNAASDVAALRHIFCPRHK